MQTYPHTVSDLFYFGLAHRYSSQEFQAAFSYFIENRTQYFFVPVRRLVEGAPLAEEVYSDEERPNEEGLMPLVPTPVYRTTGAQNLMLSVEGQSLALQVPSHENPRYETHGEFVELSLAKSLQTPFLYNDTHHSLLFHLAKMGLSILILSLIEHPGFPDLDYSQQEDGLTLIHVLASQGDWQVLSRILNQHIHSIYSEKKWGPLLCQSSTDTCSYSPIMRTIISNNKGENLSRTLQVLLRANIKVNLKNEQGYTALDFAIMHNHQEAILKLLQSGACVTRVSTVKAQELELDLTRLQYVANEKANKLSRLASLLQFKNPFEMVKRKTSYPLSVNEPKAMIFNHAAEKEALAIIQDEGLTHLDLESFIYLDAPFNVETYGAFPIFLAGLTEKVACVKALLDRGVDFNYVFMRRHIIIELLKNCYLNWNNCLSLLSLVTVKTHGRLIQYEQLYELLKHHMTAEAASQIKTKIMILRYEESSEQQIAYLYKHFFMGRELASSFQFNSKLDSPSSWVHTFKCALTGEIILDPVIVLNNKNVENLRAYDRLSYEGRQPSNESIEPQSRKVITCQGMKSIIENPHILQMLECKRLDLLIHLPQFYCPISNKLLEDPCFILGDKTVYSFLALENWLTTYHCHPTTYEPINHIQDLVILDCCINFQRFVAEVVDYHESLLLQKIIDNMDEDNPMHRPRIS